MVQKKKLNKNSGYDVTPSHVSICMNNQQHDMMVGEVEVGVLKSSHNVYVSDKYDLATVGSLSEVPLKSRTMRNHHDVLMTFGKDSQKPRLSSLDGDNYLPNILYNVLTKYPVHKENDHIHEDVEGNETISNDGVISNLEYALEDMKTRDK